MAAVQQRLAAAGLAKDAIRTLSYDLQPQFDYANGKQVPRGFLARNVIEVRADDVARVGEWLEVAVTAGGTAVQGVRFDVKARSSSSVRRSRAPWPTRGPGPPPPPRAPASAVVAVVKIEEEGVVSRPIEQPMMRMAADSAAAAPPPPIAAGEAVIRARVTLTATIK